MTYGLIAIYPYVSRVGLRAWNERVLLVDLRIRLQAHPREARGRLWLHCTKALTNFGQQLATPLGISPRLPGSEPGFHLSLRQNLGYELIKKFLHACSRGLGRTEQCLVPGFITPIGNGFHRIFFKCSAGVTT